MSCDAGQTLGKRGEWSGPDAVADKTSLRLLVGGERLGRMR